MWAGKEYGPATTEAHLRGNRLNAPKRFLAGVDGPGKSNVKTGGGLE
jgi:hypothetical protein